MTADFRHPATLYCSIHEFSEAVAIGYLKAGREHVYGQKVNGIVMRRTLDGGGPGVLCCPRCYATMGGSAWAEEPRPLRFMEADFILADRRIQSRIDRAARAALHRIDRPTPTEMHEAAEVLVTMARETIIPAWAAFGRGLASVGEMIAAAFTPEEKS